MWDGLALAAYFLATAGFAFFTRRTRSFSEFSVGGRRVPASMVFASLAATIIGPGFSVGFTSKGYSAGYAYYLLALTYGIQTMLVGLLFAPRLRNFEDCHTIGDIMRKRYGSLAHVMTGVVSVGLCIGFTAIMGKVAGSLLHDFTGWSVLGCVAAITMLTAVYTFTGGVRAVIATDALHFSWFTFIIPAMLLLAFGRVSISADELSTLGTRLSVSGFQTLGWAQSIGIGVSFLLGETLIPPYTNRALAARSQSASRWGFVSAGAFCFVWLAIVASLGVLAHDILPKGTNADDVFIGLGRTLLPPGAFGVLVAAVLAIVMSSQESVLNSATVSLVRDVLDVHRRYSDQKALIVGRLGVVLIAGASVCASAFAPSIIDGLMICYSIWAPTVLVPFLIALYRDDINPAAGASAMVAGGVTSVLWQTLWNEPFGFPAILAGLAASGLTFVLVDQLSGRRGPHGAGL